jgi:hypothetical protein
MPEIAMISRKFERGEDGEEQGVYYVGGCVNVERSDVTFPLETISSDRKLIYCSSGSQPHLDWDMNVRLFQLVIDSVKRRRDWQAIIARALMPAETSTTTSSRSPRIPRRDGLATTW